MPSEIPRIAPIIAVGVLAVAGLLLVTRMGGGGGGGEQSEDAAAIMQKALTESPRTADLRVAAGGAFEAAGRRVGFTLSWNGPVEAGGKGKPGKADLLITETQPAKPEVNMRVVSTGAEGFVRVDGRWYELSPQQFRKLFEDQRKGDTLVSDLGFDLEKWVKNPKVEGSTKVDGVDAWHITGDLDVAAMAADPDALGDESGDAFQADPAKPGRADLYIGKSDGLLRKADLSAPVVAKANGGQVTGQFDVNLAFREVNKPVKIQAPKSALPPSRLSDVPTSALGTQAEDLGRDSSGSSTGGDSKPKRDSSNGTSRSGGRSDQAYVNCVTQATDTAALEKCQALLP